jgi:hypothetical protein
MCTVLLPPGVKPIAVKYMYHISYLIILLSSLHSFILLGFVPLPSFPSVLLYPVTHCFTWHYVLFSLRSTRYPGPYAWWFGSYRDSHRRSHAKHKSVPLQTPRYEINPLTPELNPSELRCLTRFFTGDFASWTVHFVNIWVQNQQIHQLFIQFINYVW